jgi:hypothetical protein
MGIRVEGDLTSEGVALRVLSPTPQLKLISKDAEAGLIFNIITETCSRCELFQKDCNGAGSVSEGGNNIVLEKGTKEPVKRRNCRIPGRSFETLVDS